MVDLEDIKNKLKQVEELLQSIEDTIVDLGYEPPEKNIPLKKEDKIKIPRGYIRHVRDLNMSYSLDLLIENEDLRKNILYALQCSDFLNWILNRFCIDLSIQSSFYKICIIHMFSVIEGIIYGFLITQNSLCRDKRANNAVCPYHNKCNYYIPSPKNKSFREIFDFLVSNKLISKKDRRILEEIKELRDRIHIWNSKENEFTNRMYTLEKYNNVVNMLHKLQKKLLKYNTKMHNLRLNNCENMELLKSNINI